MVRTCPGFRVVAVNEDTRPLAGIVVEAFDLSALAVVASVTTNRAGEALFTGLTGPQFFRPRNRRTSGTMGDKTFTGRIMIQVVGMDALCYDFVVDPDGGGTHTTLATAIAAAITLASTSGEATIWVCSDVSEATIDIGGLGTSADIIISSPDRLKVTISAASSSDIFEQTSSGGNVAGSLRFHNIGLSVDTGFSVLSIETAEELDTLEFDRCLFSGGNLLGKTSTNQLGNVVLNVQDCIGTLGEFYDGSTGGGTHSPDFLNAYNNKLTLTNWWLGGSPGETRVQGGRYVIGSSGGITFETGAIRQWFQDLFITFSAANALFTTGANSNSVDDLIFQNIGIRITNSSGTFGDFGSAATNNNDGLFIKNIYGFGGGTGTFLTVDSDWLNLHVGNIYAKGFSTAYSGPAAGDDHGLLTGLGDDDHSGHPWLAGRSGGQIFISGTGAGEDMTLESTTHGTKGVVETAAGSALQIEADANFQLGIISTVPTLTFDSGDRIEYNRSTNIMSFYAAGLLQAQVHNVGTIAAGVNHARVGKVRAWGAGASSTVGGKFELYNAADHDGTFEFWGLYSVSDDLHIFSSDDAVVNVFTAEGQLQLPTQGSGGGTLWGGDTQLYRSAANVLRTPDSLTVDGDLLAHKPLTTQTGTYTITASDEVVIADATSASFTLTLPAASSNSGKVYWIKKIDATANTVTVDGNGSDTIDGGTTAVLAGQYESITIISDGTEWWIL